MPVVDVYNLNRDKVESLELSDSVFDVEIREHLFYEAVKSQMAKRRRGTVSTKNRAAVSGGGAKPFRQKGTGRARRGTSRSPVLVGGGVIFGPKPRNHGYSIPKKARRAALRCALSRFFKESKAVILEDFTLEQSKTKELLKILDRFEMKNALIVDEPNVNLKLSARNLKAFTYLPVEGVGIIDFLKTGSLMMTKAAVLKLEGRLKP